MITVTIMQVLQGKMKYHLHSLSNSFVISDSHSLKHLAFYSSFIVKLVRSADDIKGIQTD